MPVGESLDGEGKQYTTTLTHANVAEGSTRTRSMIHDRIRFNEGDWTRILTALLHKYKNTKHLSTQMAPKEAHKDTNPFQSWCQSYIEGKQQKGVSAN